ncbi:DUF1330 domain-containing protein [Umezawaea sp.]|uniref:DUF1330 domain-containing protein n=1 Tax=Umezawaea sp. TaxID=1955258 RepID=UPI002ED68BAF
MNDLTDHALDVLLAEDPGGPVVMLNLLRFQPDGGRETYQRYIEAVAAGMGAKYGLSVDYLGECGPALVAEEGQAWDAVALVRYPSRRAFVEMARDPEYLAVAHLRDEALVESVLQATVPREG